MLCPMLRVIVARAANEQIPTEIFAHQLPILIEMHGDDNVSIESNEAIMEKPLRWQEEYGRLSKLYGNVPEEKYTYVEHIYGPASAGRLREAMARGWELVDDYLAIDVHEIDEPAPVTAPEGPEPNSYPWIKQQLKLYGVDFVHNAKKADLEQLLRNELCERLGAEWDEIADLDLASANEKLIAANPLE